TWTSVPWLTCLMRITLSALPVAIAESKVQGPKSEVEDGKLLVSGLGSSLRGGAAVQVSAVMLVLRLVCARSRPSGTVQTVILLSAPAEQRRALFGENLRH